MVSPPLGETRRKSAVLRLSGPTGGGIGASRPVKLTAVPAWVRRGLASVKAAAAAGLICVCGRWIRGSGVLRRRLRGGHVVAHARG